MRTEKEMFDLILSVAKRDERIRAVLLNGSRANPNAPRDGYQDYDIVYLVRDFDTFLSDQSWIDIFGQRLILQMPEAMRYPSGLGHFNWMMLFCDGNRLDLTLVPIEKAELAYRDSLCVPLLDKDAMLPQLPASSEKDYIVLQPSQLYFFSCCNNFWWCLQNVAKGIARDELPYAMMMFHTVVREELHDMIDWYIGANHHFSVSPGKMGKYYKNFLPESLYRQYCATYSSATPDDLWRAVFAACDLFHILALAVADFLQFPYRQEEEDGIRKYLQNVKSGLYHKVQD